MKKRFVVLALLLCLGASLALSSAMTEGSLTFDTNLLSQGEAVHAVTTYTTDLVTGQIKITNVTFKPGEVGAYVDFDFDPQDAPYIESLSVSADAQSINAGAGVVTRDAAGNIVKVRVPLRELNSTVSGSFPFTLKLKDRIAPKGTQVRPRMSLHLKDDSEVAFKKQDVVTVKTDKPFVFKYHTSNKSNFNNADGRSIYGGLANNAATGLADPARDIIFMYNISTVDQQWVKPEGYSTNMQQFWGSGLNRTNALNKMVVTDTLPTYLAADGVTIKTARFESGKNPGWTLSTDGKTVSYEITRTPGSDLMNVEKRLQDIKLVLSFPDAKATPVTGMTAVPSYEEVRVLITPPIENKVTADLFAVNDPKTTPWASIDDPLTFILDTNEFNGKGLNDKGSNDGWTIRVDQGAMHLNHSTFVIAVQNTTPYPMRDIVISEKDFDSRFYIKYITQFQGFTQSVLQDIVGVPAGSPAETVWQNGSGAPDLSKLVIDKRVYDATMAQATQYEIDTQLPPQNAIPPHYEEVRIRFKPDYVLNPGERIAFFVQLGYRDPYHLQDDVGTSNNILTNRETVSGNFDVNGDLKGFKTPSAASHTLVKQATSIGMTKGTVFNTTGHIGENFTFRVDLGITNLGKYTRINKGEIVDVLPLGVTYRGTYVQNADLRNGWFKEDPSRLSIVDNYHGSGRQAVVIKLPDFTVKDMLIVSGTPNSYPLSFDIAVTINEFAASEWDAGAEEANKNEIFFHADNWNPVPAGITNQTPRTDRFDVDGDGSRDDEIVGAAASFKSVLGEEVRAQKYIRAKDEDTWQVSPIDMDYNADFQYRLVVKNGTAAPLAQVLLYDRLPAVGDKEYMATGGAYPGRGSAFPVRLTGPIVPDGVPAGTSYVVQYTTATNLPDNPQEAMDNTSYWREPADISDWSSVTAFAVRAKNLPARSSLAFKAPVTTPAYDEKNPQNRLYAGNSFGISYDGQNYGQSNLVKTRLKVNIPVEKVWDGGTKDSHTAVAVALMSHVEGGTPTEVAGKVLTLGPDVWKGLFENLPPANAEGKELIYTLKEIDLPDHYDMSAPVGDENAGYQVTNTYTSPKIEVRGLKVWEGGPAPDGFAVTLQLTRQVTGQPATLEDVGNPVRVTKDNDWAFSQSHDKFNHDGLLYEYGLKEVARDDTVWPKKELYETVITGPEEVKDDTGAHIAWQLTATNRYVNRDINVTGIKVWDGGPSPDAFRVYLQLTRHIKAPVTSQALPAEDVGEPIKVDKASDWRFSLTLPGYDDEANPYIYSLHEVKTADSFVKSDGEYVQDKAALEEVYEGDLLKKVVLTLTNRYVPPAPPVETGYATIRVPLTAKKTLSSGTLKAGQFSFVLKDKAGKVLATVQNDAQGLVVFPDRTFSRIVTDYTYTLEEQAGTDKGIVYDKSVYTVKVSTRDVDGKLEAAVVIEKDGQPFDGEIVFKNSRKHPQTGDRYSQYAMLLLLTAFFMVGAAVAIRRRIWVK